MLLLNSSGRVRGPKSRLEPSERLLLDPGRLLGDLLD